MQKYVMPPAPLHVATVLTACGIETVRNSSYYFHNILVATVLTACGIETKAWEPVGSTTDDSLGCNSAYRLRY